ncbi:transferase family domain-containing protein [Trichoderma austrokoningii]
MEGKILETSRLQPCSRPQSAISTVLSILDATVARFAPTGAIWVFDHDEPAEMLGYLKASFIKTLEAFPHFAGQLQWAPVSENGSHRERFHRPMIVYGRDSDPGVEWTVVEIDSSLASVAPEAAIRASNELWISSFPLSTLMMSPTNLALYDLETFHGLPSMIVQVTLVGSSGFTVAVKMAHPLADAHSLVLFMRRWASICRDEITKQDLTKDLAYPVFDPSLLDSRTAGDIDAHDGDPELVSLARSLPLHRHDWWDTTAGHPATLGQTTINSKPKDTALLQKAMMSPAYPPPWESWNISSPVTTSVIHFTGDELERLKRSATGTTAKISRLDALLAHVWTGINRARLPLLKNDDQVFMEFSLGVRARVSPSLLDTFVGSPLVLAHIGSPVSNVAASDTKIGSIASEIRTCLDRFTPEAVAAILHEEAHEVAPQRLWRAFLGRKHTLVTSWARLGVYDIDFVGKGARPRYVHAIMVAMDGLLCVMDSGTLDGGVDISLSLESETMERFLQEDKLRRP